LITTQQIKKKKKKKVRKKICFYNLAVGGRRIVAIISP